MSVVTLNAESRQPGKRGTKDVRAAGNVPCVIYGKAQEPIHFQVPVLALRDLIYTNENHTVEVTLDGTTHQCIVKALTFHPVTDAPQHVDFLALEPGLPVVLTVPVQLKGTPKGQIQGGRTRHVLKNVRIKCLPKDLPASLDVDVSDLKIGDTIHISDLGIEGVEFLSSQNQTIVTIARPKGGLEAGEDEDDEGTETPDASSTEEAVNA
ncbi:MAG: 50S ribosomal protein L25 [Rhodothermales bacterium]